MSNILVSIIIPTYRDWSRLSLCLDALSEQSFPGDRFEIIVVNNEPADLPSPNFRLPDNAKIIEEKRPGSYVARNAALRLAAGSIIGFTDSDCIPDKSWIKSAVEYFNSNPGCTRIAGKVAIFCKAKSSRLEIYDTLYAFNQKGYVNGSGTGVTANLFTYRHVFDEVGYFDETLMSGGDFSWGILANKKGYRIDYVEDVIVKHPARDTLRELVKKEKRVGGSQAKFQKNSGNILVKFFEFIKALKPRRSEIRLINSKGRGLSVLNKIYIFLLRHYLLGIRAYTKLKVQMGQRPNRA